MNRNNRKNPRRRERGKRSLRKRNGAGKKPRLLIDTVRRKQNVTPAVMRAPLSFGMPDVLHVDLLWSGIVNMQTSTAQIAAMYEGNNPWDPDPQLGGTSARDYQILQLMYRYCRCYGSEIDVSACIVNGNGFEVSVAALNKSTGVTYDLLQTLPQFMRGRHLTDGGITETRIKNFCSTKTLFGIQNLNWDLDHSFDLDNGESGTSVTEPSRKWYWYIYASSNGSQTGINCSVNVTIRYQCKFFSKKYLSSLSDVTDDGDDTLPLMTGTTVKVIDQTV
jgi:hypothetical protein